MTLVMIQPIVCDQVGSKYNYELDTKQFGAEEGTAIFKMCTSCGIFVDDFSELFCDKCNSKLQYVDVSDVEQLRKWLNDLDIISKKSKVEDEESNDDGKVYPENVLVDEDHVCSHDDNGSCGDDCIDCADRKWEQSPGPDDDVSGFWGTYHDGCSECDACVCFEDEDYDYDDDDDWDSDSVS